MSVKIEQIYAREILNSRGKPTVEVEMTCTNGLTVAASVPSGTSTGKYEALEIYDGGSRYHGKGTRKAVENVNQILAPAVIGMDVTDQRKIDQAVAKERSFVSTPINGEELDTYIQSIYDGLSVAAQKIFQ